MAIMGLVGGAGHVTGHVTGVSGVECAGAAGDGISTITSRVQEATGEGISI